MHGQKEVPVLSKESTRMRRTMKISLSSSLLMISLNDICLDIKLEVIKIVVKKIIAKWQQRDSNPQPFSL